MTPKRHLPGYYIGRQAMLVIRPIGQTEQQDAELRVQVEIKDARAAFGRTDLLVSPITGNGRQWVSLTRLEPVK